MKILFSALAVFVATVAILPSPAAAQPFAETHILAPGDATLNNVFLWLASNPERRREIIETPGNINAVVDELLRVFSVTFSGRTLTQDFAERIRHTTGRASHR